MFVLVVVCRTQEAPSSLWGKRGHAEGSSLPVGEEGTRRRLLPSCGGRWDTQKAPPSLWRRNTYQRLGLDGDGPIAELADVVPEEDGALGVEADGQGPKRRQEVPLELGQLGHVQVDRPLGHFAHLRGGDALGEAYALLSAFPPREAAGGGAPGTYRRLGDVQSEHSRLPKRVLVDASDLAPGKEGVGLRGSDAFGGGSRGARERTLLTC